MKFSSHTLIGITLALIGIVTAFSMIMPDRWVSKLKQEFASRFIQDGSVVAFSSVGSSFLTSSVSAACPDGTDRQSCMEKSILEIVNPYGPVEAIQTLSALLADGTMQGRGDYHDYVHRIGRLTAKKEGLNPTGFFLCPVDYNYGCQHGFFEQALVIEPDAVKAATLICDPSLMTDRPLKFFFYCYHGVGHGVMMAKAYDLEASLEVCDGFPGQEQQTGCQQGVFMENVVGYMNGTARREGMFSDTNRLAPCDRLEARFQWQCFINLGGYLAASAGTGPGAVERATEPCLKAGPDNIHPCLASVGLASTNPGWQLALTPNFTSDEAKNGAEICAHFPVGYEGECVTAGIENLAQFDRGDTQRMVQFCQAVDEKFRTLCFARIGPTVKNELPAGTTAETICASIPEEYRSFCIQGVLTSS